MTMETEDVHRFSSLPPILDSYQSARCPEKVIVLNSMHKNTNESDKSKISLLFHILLIYYECTEKELNIYQYLLYRDQQLEILNSIFSLAFIYDTRTLFRIL